MTIDKFPGFSYPEKNWYQFPKSLNGYMSQLSGNEFKILAYIVRKTWGFNKVEDKISYKQFLNGIVNKEGIKIFDGLGMERKTLMRNLANLEKKGFIEVNRSKGEINTYRLKYLEVGDKSGLGVVPKSGTTVGDKKGTTGRGQKRDTTIEDNTIDNNTIKDKTILSAKADGKEINLLIEKFKPINPSYEKLFANKTQRSVLEKMSEKYGFEKLGRMIDALPEIVNQKFAPRISTPCQLEDKLGQLLIFINQNKKTHCSVEERKA